FLAVLSLGVFQRGRAVGEQLGGLGAGRHVGDVPLDPLELVDLLAEGLPFVGVAHGRLDGRKGDAVGLGGDADAAAVEGGHGDLEAFAFFTEAVGGRNAAIFEYELGGAARANAE